MFNYFRLAFLTFDQLLIPTAKYRLVIDVVINHILHSFKIFLFDEYVSIHVSVKTFQTNQKNHKSEVH
jgi:hypothetical protein